MDTFLADSLGFFAAQGQPPVADQKLGDHLHLMHATSAPPFAPNLEAVSEAHSRFWTCVEGQSQLHVIESVTDMLNVADIGKTQVLFGLQNTPDDLDRQGLTKLSKMKLRVLALAYNRKNSFGSGYYNLDCGLTEHGKQVLEWCAEEQIIVDLSHASHCTARDILKYAPKELPLFASHGGCYAVYNNPRNLPDDVLRAIAKRGGVVGIYTLTFGLHPLHNSVREFARHVAHAINICGAKAVCVGSDGRYVQLEYEEWKKLFAFLKTKADPDDLLHVRFPDDIPKLNNAGVSRMSVLHEGLKLARVVSHTEIDGIMGSNFRTFLLRSLPK